MTVNEALFQDVHARLTAIMGNAAYHYGQTLKAVEREILEADGAEINVNSLAAPMILIQRGPLISEAPPGGGTLGEFELRQEFRVLFKLPRSNDADVGNAIEDMTKALFVNGTMPGRLADWSVEREDPETRARHPGPLMVFSTVYSEAIGDPSTGH